MPSGIIVCSLFLRVVAVDLRTISRRTGVSEPRNTPTKCRAGRLTSRTSWRLTIFLNFVSAFELIQMIAFLLPIGLAGVEKSRLVFMLHFFSLFPHLRLSVIDCFHSGSDRRQVKCSAVSIPDRRVKSCSHGSGTCQVTNDPFDPCKQCTLQTYILTEMNIHSPSVC